MRVVEAVEEFQWLWFLPTHDGDTHPVVSHLAWLHPWLLSK